MKVVTLYSPSHKKMYEEFFLPSFPNDDRLELKAVEAPQLAGEKPTFNSSEWKNFMQIKSELLYNELLTTPDGEYYLFVDTDILIVQNFFEFFQEATKNYDVLCQSDSPSPYFPNYCTGIICIKNTENTRNLMKAVNVIMHDTTLVPGQPTFANEQEVFTWLLVNKHKFFELKDIKFNILPFEVAFTYGAIAGKVWDGTDTTFQIPSKDKLLFLHGNYCHYEHKEQLLELFKEKLKTC